LNLAGVIVRFIVGRQANNWGNFWGGRDRYLGIKLENHICAEKSYEVSDAPTYEAYGSAHHAAFFLYGPRFATGAS